MKIECGFSRLPNGKLYWSKYERDEALCGCSIFSFLCFYFTILREECAK